MEKFIYIQKDTKGVVELDIALGEGYMTGSSWDDYLQGAWLLLTDAQIGFAQANSGASHREIFDMQLTSPPAEPTLSDVKSSALNQVEQTADSKLQELYPPFVIIAKAYSTNEAENAAYFEGFNRTQQSIDTFRFAAIAAINQAANREAVNATVDVFNSQIAVL